MVKYMYNPFVEPVFDFPQHRNFVRLLFHLFTMEIPEKIKLNI